MAPLEVLCPSGLDTELLSHYRSRTTQDPIRPEIGHRDTPWILGSALDCTKMWYERSAEKSPNVACVHHHLAVQERSNIVKQLFYYSKALVSLMPFENARESVMLLFNPFIQDCDKISQKCIAVKVTFAVFHEVLSTYEPRKVYWPDMISFLSGFEAHVWPRDCVTKDLRLWHSSTLYPRVCCNRTQVLSLKSN